MDELYKLDPLGLINRLAGSPLGKEPTVVDVTRLAIQQIEEIFLQGFATSPCLGRERAAGGLRDATNLKSNHECILTRTVSGCRASQAGDRTAGASAVDTSDAQRTPETAALRRERWPCRGRTLPRQI